MAAIADSAPNGAGETVTVAGRRDWLRERRAQRIPGCIVISITSTRLPTGIVAVILGDRRARSSRRN